MLFTPVHEPCTIRIRLVRMVEKTEREKHKQRTRGRYRIVRFSIFLLGKRNARVRFELKMPNYIFDVSNGITE